MAENKFLNKDKKNNEFTNSSAYNKAKEMESGFVKSRKANPEEASQNDKVKLNSESQVKTEKKTKVKKEVFTAEQEGIGNSKQKNYGAYQITLSPSLCMTVFVTLAITLAFVFLFGFILGKGMISEPIMAEPEKFNPQTQSTVSENAENGEQPENIDQILPKEELKFLTTLKAESNPETEVEEIEPEQEQISSEVAQESLAIPKAQPQGETNQIASIDQVFDYDVRVAAFRREEQADNLRQKLEGGGFRTKKIVETDEKGNWYFVHIVMRAKEKQFQENIGLIKDFAIRDYIVKEKKAVE